MSATRARWGWGTKLEKVLRGDHCQCGGCGLYFNSTAAFDRHRRGTPGQDRRCLTTDEMLLAGMATNATGWWVTALGGPRYQLENSTSDDPLEGAA